MTRLLPLFPLQLVAFPGGAVPLHIFEPRYREMVGEAEAHGTEFGIVLARDGGVTKTGCTVVVEQVLQRYPDGRFDVLTRGQRRFEIQSVDQELEYLRARVEYFADDDALPVALALRQSALHAWREADFGGEPPDVADPLLSFRLASAISDLDAQIALLMMRSEQDRLEEIIRLIPRYLEKRAYVAKMQVKAPTNGKGHRPADGD